MNDSFDDVIRWLAELQRDTRALEWINTRERIIREIVASQALADIDAREHVGDGA